MTAILTQIEEILKQSEIPLNGQEILDALKKKSGDSSILPKKDELELQIYANLNQHEAPSPFLLVLPGLFGIRSKLGSYIELEKQGKFEKDTFLWVPFYEEMADKQIGRASCRERV